MAEEIRVNYEALEEMATLCKKNAENLEATKSRLQEIAHGMNTEALVGDVGLAFSEALLGPFSSSIEGLTIKFKEVADDIQRAMDEMRRADESIRF